MPVNEGREGTAHHLVHEQPGTLTVRDPDRKTLFDAEVNRYATEHDPE